MSNSEDVGLQYSPVSKEPGEEAKGSLSYLTYKLGGETYGTPLTHISNVIKIPKLKPIPSIESFFKGVMNLRGQIISVIDLREKMGIKTEHSENTLVFIVRDESGALGFIVDSAESVISIQDNDIERPISANLRIPTQYYLGIAKHEESLIIILNLQALAAELLKSTSSQ
ncbi:MAG: chemotaxis protein CheW [Bdellovibrionia bacterium]